MTLSLNEQFDWHTISICKWSIIFRKTKFSDVYLLIYNWNKKFRYFLLRIDIFVNKNFQISGCSISFIICICSQVVFWSSYSNAMSVLRMKHIGFTMLDVYRQTLLHAMTMSFSKDCTVTEKFRMRHKKFHFNKCLLDWLASLTIMTVAGLFCMQQLNSGHLDIVVFMACQDVLRGREIINTCHL